MLGSRNIEINKKYFEQLGEAELIGIIKHELCHYHLHIEGKGYKHCDKDFRDLLKKVGAPRFCSVLPEEKKRRSKQKFIFISAAAASWPIAAKDLSIPRNTCVENARES